MIQTKATTDIDTGDFKTGYIDSEKSTDAKTLKALEAYDQSLSAYLNSLGKEDLVTQSRLYGAFRVAESNLMALNKNPNMSVTIRALPAIGSTPMPEKVKEMPINTKKDTSNSKSQTQNKTVASNPSPVASSPSPIYINPTSDTTNKAAASVETPTSKLKDSTILIIGVGACVLVITGVWAFSD
jgi:hypothetical protein